MRTQQPCHDIMLRGCLVFLLSSYTTHAVGATGSTSISISPQFMILFWYTGLISAMISIIALIVYVLIRHRKSPGNEPLTDEENLVPGILMHQSPTVPIEPRYGDKDWGPSLKTNKQSAPVMPSSKALPDTIGALIDTEDEADIQDIIIPKAAMFRDSNSIQQLKVNGWTENQIARKFGWGLGEVQLALHLARKEAILTMK